MDSARRAGEWRVGDIVRVDERYELTNLGEGAIIDIETYPDTRSAQSVLVRFEHGPAKGVWYSVGTLRQLRDLHGNSLEPQRPTLPAVGAPRPPETIRPSTIRRPTKAAERPPSSSPSRRARPSVGGQVARGQRLSLSCHRSGSVEPGGCVVSRLGDQREGRVLQSPPQFHDGRLWAPGWLRVRWDDGSVVNIHSIHVMPNRYSFVAGDVVEWFMHPAKPRGVVRRRVYEHFFEIELFDPPPNQARQVRLISTPIRLVSETERTPPAPLPATSRDPQEDPLTDFQRWWRENEHDLAGQHFAGGKWKGIYHLVATAFEAGRQTQGAPHQIHCATCGSENVYGLYFFSPSKTLMAFCDRHKLQTIPCVMRF